MGVARQSVFAALALLAACQCETIPSTACFAGEACARAGGGGAADGGGSEASGGGAPGGGAAGTGGGGEPGYAPLNDVFIDAGIREEAEWVREDWVHRGPAIFKHVDVSIPGGGASALGPLFRGGVMLMSGRVLLVPGYALDFLLVDPITGMVIVIPAGPSDAGVTTPRFGAAVLGCDGRAYVLPDHEGGIFRFTEESNGALSSRQFPWSKNGVSGAVVTGPCDAGLLHLAVATQGFWYELTLDENGLLLSTEHMSPQPLAPQGITRTNEDGYLIGAAPSCFVIQDGGRVCTALPSGGGLVFYGSVYTTGSSSIMSYNVAFNTSTATVEGFTSSNKVFSVPSPVAASRWPLSRGDGYVYGLGSELRAVTDQGPGPDGGFDDFVVCEDCDDAGFDSNGLVNGGGGTIVAAPASGSIIRIYVPVDGGAPPRSLVLSPFLNKL